MEDTLAYCAAILYKEFAAYSATRLQELDLTQGQLPFILYVGKHPGCTPSQLREALSMDWGHVQRSVTRLEEDGFLRKERAEEDGRTYRLTLTRQGERGFRVSHQVFQAWDRGRLCGLSEEERDQLLKLLHKLLHTHEGIRLV